MAEQLDMQREDYEYALKMCQLVVCGDCDALTIATCEDVTRGECFYCGSKNMSTDKKKVQESLNRKIREGAL